MKFSKQNFLFRYLFRDYGEKASPKHLEVVEDKVKAEDILIEEFRNSNITIYRLNDEMSSTFNFYLLVAGVILTGTPAIINYILSGINNAIDRKVFYLFAATILYMLNRISITFLIRFFELAKEISDNLKVINKINSYYKNKLKDSVSEIDDILYTTQTDAIYIPIYIRNIVVIFSALCLAAALLLVVQIFPYDSVIKNFAATGPKGQPDETLYFSYKFFFYVFILGIATFLSIMFYEGLRKKYNKKKRTI